MPTLDRKATMLEVNGIDVFYGAVQALKSVSLSVKQGSISTIIGANGAGKTTLLKTLSGILPTLGGTVLYEGKKLTGLSPGEIVALGMALVPEGRQIFGNLSVIDNLRLGAYLYFRRRHREEIRAKIENIYSIFPILRERRNQLSGTMSGGEQQMLAIGRALMSRPRLLMMDEPSMGLAPLVVREIFRVILELRIQGITVLLVEQNARAALKTADFGYILETGQVVFQGNTQTLIEEETIKHAYLGKQE